jgi:methyltransferase (TIGR00027 family)
MKASATRSDDDAWDIQTGVGSTAAIVAALRAAEANSPNSLVRDEFAELLISAPELEAVRANISAWAASAEHQTDSDYRRLVNYHAVRTHYFDRFCAESSAAGVEQIVILAAGLDSRAYRLAWPAGTAVYEIDMPGVLEYKSATLACHGAAPTAVRREVGVDLRKDWPTALQGKGFDSTVPTAWLIEGLLPFLSARAQHDVFARLDGLSAPASRLAAEDFVGAVGFQQAVEQQRAMDAVDDQLGKHGSLDPGDVWHDDANSNCADWFRSRGWHTTCLDSREEAERLGRPAPSVLRGQAPMFANFIAATKPGAGGCESGER